MSWSVTQSFIRFLHSAFVFSVFLSEWLALRVLQISRCVFVLAGLFVLSYLSIASAGTDDVQEPQGYRMEDYDAPVPSQLTGATLVNAHDVKRLLEQGAVVVDVIPEHRKPDFLPENQIWIPPAHEGVAGSIWLPDIGYGVLSEATIKYFKDNLEKYTNSNIEHPVVFYCRIDCWMSWNAGKRALSYGYTNVYWFSYGIDGWKFEDFELQSLVAEPGQRQ